METKKVNTVNSEYCTPPAVPFSSCNLLQDCFPIEWTSVSKAQVALGTWALLIVFCHTALTINKIKDQLSKS